MAIAMLLVSLFLLVVVMVVGHCQADLLGSAVSRFRVGFVSQANMTSHDAHLVFYDEERAEEFRGRDTGWAPFFLSFLDEPQLCSSRTGES